MVHPGVAGILASIRGHFVTLHFRNRERELAVGSGYETSEAP